MIKLKEEKGRTWIFRYYKKTILGHKNEPYYKTESEILKEKKYNYNSLSIDEKKIYTMVRKYTDKELLDRVQELKSFKEFPKGYWILAVRSKADKPNKFDDKFYIYKCTDFVRVLTGTTNPGLSILKGGFKKYNKVGAAVIKSNEWYYNIYKYGLHNRKMPALRQRREKPILYYRDGNMNSKSEELGKVQSGVIYTNFHGATYVRDSLLVRDKINGWSAGCCTINDSKKYYDTMNTFKQSGQKYFTMCLIKEF